MVKSVLVLIILIVFITLAKCYKRKNEINVHLITEESYERYMDQESEYNNMMGYPLECTN